MRAFTMILSVAFLTTASMTVALGQQLAAPEPRTYASAADVAALLAKARAERKDQPTISQRILQLAPYNANLEYRASVGPAAVHETEAELFYVIEGSATMTTGGKLVNEKRTDAANLTGTAIEGGTTRAVSKGDFIIVPEKTPHWFNAITGTIVLMSLHVPRPVVGAAK
jgi:mannose-6-phosphate isomerase-like protein (cupin superfamily)